MSQNGSDKQLNADDYRAISELKIYYKNPKPSERFQIDIVASEYIICNGIKYIMFSEMTLSILLIRIVILPSVSRIWYFIPLDMLQE